MPDPSAHLGEALAALTTYFVGTRTLRETLNAICQQTIKAVPVTDHVGITLLADGELKTSVFTHPEVPEIDLAQYRTGDGPCIDAYRTGVPYVIDSTRTAGRWQAFRDSAARHGVLSTLSLPLLPADEPIGAINLYSHVEHAYDDATQRVATLFAAQAAFALANVQAYWDARSLSENLEQAISSRALIEQAKGVIMMTMRCDEGAALKVLIERAQRRNVTLRDIAAEIVRNASGPGQAHHA